MPLTSVSIRNAKPREKSYRLFDEKGLYLEVFPSGSKLWRFKFRYEGKEKRLALGKYPEISLAEARDRRDEARRTHSKGIDPSAVRREAKLVASVKSGNSFESVAREWWAKQASAWVSSHGGRILRRFERDIFPWLGARPIADISSPELLAVLRRVESRGAIETAHRALSNCGQVFRYAVATGRAERDPSADLRGALSPVKIEHFAALTEGKRVGELLRAVDDYEGSFVVRCALRLAPLVFVRPGELRHAMWKDFDLESARWTFLASKTDAPHIVPLSKQALSILREIQPLTGSGNYIFPSARTSERPMSDNAILAALRRMGFEKDEMSGHGFRAMARTILEEVLKFAPALIEQQLAHTVRDPLGRAYNRTTHLDERTVMMQRWSDYLEQLKQGAQVIPIRAA